MSTEMLEAKAVITELGEDIDLLFKPDEWLENHRVSIQQKMSLLASELHSVLTAQHAKQRCDHARIPLTFVSSILQLGEPADDQAGDTK